MNEWVDNLEKIDKHTNERINKWMNGLMKEWVNEWMNLINE